MGRALTPFAVPLAGVLIDGARAVLDRVLPDPEKRAAAELELRKLEADGSFAERAELATQLAQLDVNKVEAGTDAYRGGWRPFIGWTCGAALAWQYVGVPMIGTAFAIAGRSLPPLPGIESILMELVFTLLGVGSLRTVEKLRGKA